MTCFGLGTSISLEIVLYLEIDTEVQSLLFVAESVREELSSRLSI
jgi:hypothetical protein